MERVRCVGFYLGPLRLTFSWHNHWRPRVLWIPEIWRDWKPFAIVRY